MVVPRATYTTQNQAVPTTIGISNTNTRVYLEQPIKQLTSATPTPGYIIPIYKITNIRDNNTVVYLQPLSYQQQKKPTVYITYQFYKTTSISNNKSTVYLQPPIQLLTSET